MAKILTAKAIEAMKPGPVSTSFSSPGGARSWAFRHRVGGKPRKLTIGRYPAIGLAEARQAARQAAQAVALGKDPAGDKRQAREEAPRLTVSAQVREYHKRHLSKLRSGADALRVLEMSAVAAWGDRPVNGIAKKDVVALIDRVHDERGPAAANMALARVRSFLGWLAARDVIPVSPAAGVRMPAHLEARDRVLSEDELRLVWQASGGLSEPFGAFVRLLILTGQRRDEVARMTAAELAGDLWIIPGDRAKNGEPHAVPLSPEALAVLAEVKRIGRFIFTTNGRIPISGYSKVKAALDRAVATLAETEGTGIAERLDTARSSADVRDRARAAGLPGACDRGRPEPSLRHARGHRRRLSAARLHARKAGRARGVGPVCARHVSRVSGACAISRGSHQIVLRRSKRGFI